MSLVQHWRDRHPAPSGRGRVLFLVALLILVIILMLSAEDITRGFATVFFPSPDSTVTMDE